MHFNNNEYLNGLQIHLIAISLFIRDDENVIYLGIIMVIISFLLCFINITRANEFRLPESVAKP